MTHKCDARPHIILSSIFSIPKSLHFEYLFKIFNTVETVKTVETVETAETVKIVEIVEL